MNEKQESKPYVYARYINIIIERFQDGLIYEDKLQQLLETLIKWEGKFKKLGVKKKEVVMSLLWSLDEEGESLRDL